MRERLRERDEKEPGQARGKKGRAKRERVLAVPGVRREERGATAGALKGPVAAGAFAIQDHENKQYKNIGVAKDTRGEKGTPMWQEMWRWRGCLEWRGSRRLQKQQRMVQQKSPWTPARMSRLQEAPVKPQMPQHNQQQMTLTQFCKLVARLPDLNIMVVNTNTTYAFLLR